MIEEALVTWKEISPIFTGNENSSDCMHFSHLLSQYGLFQQWYFTLLVEK